MSSPRRRQFLSRLLLASLSMPLLGASISANPAGDDDGSGPLQFFEGRTESISTIKVITRKPYRSRTLGTGKIGADGTLHLVQRVEEDGKSPYDRRWRMREIGPGRFAGTMTEAKGPVTVQEIDGRYRFRFKMKGGVSIEQWLTPLPGGKAARSKLTIRKLGLTVGHSDGMIRKL